MKAIYFARLACAMSLALGSLGYTDNEVASWAQQTLMTTLSASYVDDPDEIAAVKRNYYPSAWEPLVNFFHEKVDLIRAHQLTLHPRPLTNPVVVASGTFAGFPSWRVEQSFNVPEIPANIHFSLLIIIARPQENPPFLIESLNLGVEKY